MTRPALPVILRAGLTAGVCDITAALIVYAHWFAASVYYGASRRLPVLVQHPWVTGPLYGIAVYFFMQLIVIPLSAIGPRPFSLRLTLIGNVIHIFCVGLPIALTVRRYSR